MRFLCIILNLLIICCSCSTEFKVRNVKSKNNNAKLAHNAIKMFIDRGDDFDRSDIENRLLSDGNYWYLDALIAYDIEFDRAKEVHFDIGGEFWESEIEPVIRISKDTIYLFDLGGGDNLRFTTYGSYEYYPNTTTLEVVPNSNEKHSCHSISAKIIAYRDDSFVVEWSGVNAGYRALFRVVDYAAMSQKEVDVRMSKVFAETGAVNSDRVPELILGEWSCETVLEYGDSDYKNLLSVAAVCGKIYSYPGPSYSYIFYEDGTLLEVYSVDNTEDDVPSEKEYEVFKHSWNYDIKSNMLTITNYRGKSKTYYIIAINDRHLVWDYSKAVIAKATSKIVDTRFYRDGYRRTAKYVDMMDIQ